VALAALSVSACGKKGPPVAPERRFPVPPSAITAAVDERAIIITWTDPAKRFDGTALKDLVEVRLHRREDTDGTPLKPAILSGRRIVGYDEIAAIRLDSPAPAVVRGTSVRWEDRQGLVLGHRYVYVVTAIDSSGRSSPPSERRAITFLAAPTPPRDVQARAGDGKVELSWQAPTELADGTPVSGDLQYIVLRGAEGEAPSTALTPQPVTGTSYLDAGLDNDVEYRYAVRAVRRDPQATVTGAASTAVAATPVRTTPPNPPTNLVVVPAPTALTLRWDASPDPAVATYAIYRATGAGDFVRIATTLAGTTLFVDRDIRSGGRYRYAVTAIDGARHPNESAHSNEVAITAP
jgi:hypothetical protein